MSEEDDLIGELETLLEKFPRNSGLAAWQHFFRRIVYTAGLRVLKNNPELIVGPALSPQSPALMPMMHTMQAGGPSPAVVVGPIYFEPAGGPQKPYRPNFIVFTCIASGDCPPPPQN